MPPAASPLLIPAISAANFTVGVGAFVAIGVLSPIAEAFAMSEAEAGLVMTVYAVAYAIGSPLLISLTGGLARRDLLAGALLLFAVAALLMALAPGKEAFLAGRALAACAAGIVSPVGAAVAAASAPPETRGRALAAAFFGLTLAQVVGVPGGAWIGHAFGWRVDFWIVAALALVAALLVRRFAPTGLRTEPIRLAALAAILRDRRAMAALSFTPIYVGSAYVFFTFVAPLLEAGMGLGRDGLSLFLLVLGLGAVAGNLVAGRLSDRIGAAPTLAVLAAVNAATLPVFSLLPIPFPLLLAAGFVWSAFGWGFFAVQQARLVAVAPERATLVLALNAATLYLGVSLGSALGGALAEVYGYSILGFGASAVSAAALLALFLAERRLAKPAAAR